MQPRKRKRDEITEDSTENTVADSQLSPVSLTKKAKTQEGGADEAMVIDTTEVADHAYQTTPTLPVASVSVVGIFASSPPSTAPANYPFQDPRLQIAKTACSRLLKQFFALFHPEDRPSRFNLAEILRMLASYHRKHTFNYATLAQSDIFQTAQFLCEKALVLEPLNENARKELEKQIALQPRVAKKSYNTSSSQHQRFYSFHKKCYEHGDMKFFLDAIDHYVLRLSLTFGDNFERLLVDGLLHLSLAKGFLNMMAKHLHPVNYAKVSEFFAQAVNEINSSSPPTALYTTNNHG